MEVLSLTPAIITLINLIIQSDFLIVPLDPFLDLLPDFDFQFDPPLLIPDLHISDQRLHVPDLRLHIVIVHLLLAVHGFQSLYFSCGLLND